MHEPITLNDIALFIQEILKVFSPTLLLSFSLMITFSLIFGIRKIILGGKY